MMQWHLEVGGESIMVVLGSSIPDGQLIAEDTTQDCDCTHWSKEWSTTGFQVNASVRCEHGIIIIDNPPVLALQNLEAMIKEILLASPPKDPLVRLVWDLISDFSQARKNNNVCEESDDN
jgi:hypothetical protein